MKYSVMNYFNKTECVDLWTLHSRLIEEKKSKKNFLKLREKKIFAYVIIDF